MRGDEKNCRKCQGREFYSRNKIEVISPDTIEITKNFFSQNSYYEPWRTVFDTVCPGWAVVWKDYDYYDDYLSFNCNAKELNNFEDCIKVENSTENGSQTTQCDNKVIVDHAPYYKSIVDTSDHCDSQRVNYFFSPCPNEMIFGNSTQIPNTCNKDVPLIMLASICPHCGIYKKRVCSECILPNMEDLDTKTACFCSTDLKEKKSSYGRQIDNCSFDPSNRISMNSLYTEYQKNIPFISLVEFFCANTKLTGMVYDINKEGIKVNGYEIDILITCVDISTK